jgi:MmyB-like transcription regulator ligand binding domain
MVGYCAEYAGPPEHARRYGDHAFVSLIRDLLQESPRFQELWRRHEVPDAQIGTKSIEHPELGRLSPHHLQSIATSHPDLRLTQFVPADDATRSALARRQSPRPGAAARSARSRLAPEEGCREL